MDVNGDVASTVQDIAGGQIEAFAAFVILRRRVCALLPPRLNCARTSATDMAILRCAIVAAFGVVGGKM
jgi:hypothetical protein